MNYAIIVNGRSYDLPPKTLNIADRLDEVLKVDSIKGLSLRQKYEKLHSFIGELVGNDNLKEMFGSDKLEEIDLSELTLIINMVVDAYDKPINDYNVQKTRDRLNSLPLDKLVSTVNAAEKAVNMPLGK